MKCEPSDPRTRLQQDQRGHFTSGGGSVTPGFGPRAEAGGHWFSVAFAARSTLHYTETLTHTGDASIIIEHRIANVVNFLCSLSVNNIAIRYKG